MILHTQVDHIQTSQWSRYTRNTHIYRVRPTLSYKYCIENYFTYRPHTHVHHTQPSQLPPCFSTHAGPPTSTSAQPLTHLNLILMLQNSVVLIDFVWLICTWKMKRCFPLISGAPDNLQRATIHRWKGFELAVVIGWFVFQCGLLSIAKNVKNGSCVPFSTFFALENGTYRKDLSNDTS